MRTLEGVWLGKYEYGQGADDTPQFTEDRMQFARVGGTWHGTSLPNSEDSKVTMILTQDNRQLYGTWMVQTAPNGHYGGREFRGVVTFLLNESGDVAEGLWLGANTDQSRIKQGSWILRRQSS